MVLVRFHWPWDEALGWRSESSLSLQGTTFCFGGNGDSVPGFCLSKMAALISVNWCWKSSYSGTRKGARNLGLLPGLPLTMEPQATDFISLSLYFLNCGLGMISFGQWFKWDRVEERLFIHHKALWKF